MVNSLTLPAGEFSSAEYEIINEQADGFRKLAYHARVDITARQLVAAGLRVLEVLDTDGRPLPAEGDHPGVPFFYFVATQILT